MNIEIVIKEAFAVIGKEAFTWDGDGLLTVLWSNLHKYETEIMGLAKKGSDGKPLCTWGAMSSKYRDFATWENNLSIGLFLAGYEVPVEAEAPSGWTKWVVPGFAYAKIKVEGDNFFYRTLEYLKSKDMAPVAACHFYTDLKTGEDYFWFPIRKLDDFSGNCNKAF